MSKPLFPWKPDLGATQTLKPDVSVTKFGDGYEMRLPNGVNYRRRDWQVSFSGPEAIAGEIMAFLEARGAHEAFEWVDPRGRRGTYKCDEWSDAKVGPGVIRVSAAFKEVSEL